MAEVLEVREAYRVQGWSKAIAECRASGLTNREFCQQRGISERQYYYWLKKLRESASEAVAPRLVELEQHSETPEMLFRVEYGQARMELPANVDMDAVAAVLRSLQSHG